MSFFANHSVKITSYYPSEPALASCLPRFSFTMWSKLVHLLGTNRNFSHSPWYHPTKYFSDIPSV